MKKILVYYSLNGNTRAVAKRIASKLKIKAVEIHTLKAYSDDVDVLQSLAKKEIEIGCMPQIAPLKIDFSKYDAVVLGTPVWWRTFAPAVKTFLKSVDWKGKTLYPFVTNEGTIGHVNSDLKKAARGAMICDTLSVVFDEEGNQLTSAGEVNNWVSAVAEDGYEDDDE